MLSVIIATHESERPLVRTLAALVPGAVAGLIREVIISDAGSRDDTAAVADVAGCDVLVASGSVGAGLKQAAQRAKAPWLLFLRPGTVPDADWIGEARAFMDEAERQGIADRAAATFRPAPQLGSRRSGFMEGLALIAMALWPSARSGRGLLIAKRFYDAAGGHPDAEDAEQRLLRRLGGQVVMLQSAATVPR
jgi:GT2 family glycosyltransferase